MSAARERAGTQTPLWLHVSPVVFLLFWSGGFTFAKMGLAHAEPITFLALRYALVLAVLLPFALILRPALPKTAVDWGHLAVVGIFIQVLYFGLTYLSFASGLSAGAVALIVSLQPILVAIAAPHFGDQTVGLRRWIGLALGLAGAAIVIIVRLGVEAGSLFGLFCAVGALVAITLATVYEKRFGVTHHPVTANVIQYALGFAAILPLAWALEEMHIDWTGELALSIGYLVICNSLIAITLLLAMIRHGEASRVSALFFLVPPMAAIIAWVIIGEEMPLMAWPGIILAAVGVAIAGQPIVRIRRS